jgi:DNA-binding PadR family transcriptional regulator
MTYRSGWGAFGDTPDDGRHQHRRPPGGPWQDWVGSSWPHQQGRGPGGPPPWLASLLGQQPEQNGRGPRVRRGDVRAAILDVLRTASEGDQTVNGYQVIQQIAERTDQEWRPSPGSVYPTIQQLEDEGLVEADDERGRRSLRLTEEGRAYVTERAEELSAVWRPFERDQRRRDESGWPDFKTEVGRVMSATWQIVTAGSDLQKRAAVEVLVDTRRRLYQILAEGDASAEETDGSAGDAGDPDRGPSW